MNPGPDLHRGAGVPREGSMDLDSESIHGYAKQALLVLALWHHIESWEQAGVMVMVVPMVMVMVMEMVMVMAPRTVKLLGILLTEVLQSG